MLENFRANVLKGQNKLNREIEKEKNPHDLHPSTSHPSEGALLELNKAHTLKYDTR